MRHHHLAPAEICLVLLLTLSAHADPIAASSPSLNQTLDGFHPTPKQTIALRDFLGSLSNRIVPIGQQANGLSYFDLRDAKNQRTGQIAVGQDPSEQSIFVARLSGPATFDPARKAIMPRAQHTKMRAAISALLAGAEAGPVYEAATARYRDLFLRDRPMLALMLQTVSFPDRVIESEASWYSDGSGIIRSLRAPVGMQALAPIHVSVKFLPPLEGDGQKAFRQKVLGVDADLTASLADFGNKLPCAATGCPATPPMAIKGDLHLTAWPHAVVPSAPAYLIAQISPPPILPDILQDHPPPDATGLPGAIDATGRPPDSN